MRLEKETPETMGRANKQNVLQLIRQQGPISRADVAKVLGMSRSTVSSIVEQLILDGRVTEGDRGQSTAQGGKRPIQLRFVHDAKFSLGIDIGSAKALALITDLNGDVVARKKFPTHVDGIPSIDHVVQQVHDLLDECGVPSEKIVGTGIGIPGNTDNELGMIIESPGLKLSNFHLKNYVAGKLPHPIVLDNDVNMAVIGERWRGAARNSLNAILVAIGTGIGAGLLIDGKIYRGSKGFAGEIGHLHLDPFTSGPKLGLGDFGPLEQLASGKGIESQVKALSGRFPESELWETPMTAEDIFAAAAKQDALATEVLDRALSLLSFSVANMVTLLNPDMVIIGGGVSKAGETLLGAIRKGVRRLSPVPCEIVLAGLGEEAAAFGAAATALIQAGEIGLRA